MPRFYFDVRNGSKVAVDEVGLDCDDLAAAEREAALSAIGLARDGLRGGGSRQVAIEVRSEAGQSLFSVVLTLRRSLV